MILRNLSWKLISQNSSIQNFSFQMKNSKRLRQDLTKWSTSLSISNSCQISFQTNISLIRVCFAVKRSCTMEKKYFDLLCSPPFYYSVQLYVTFFFTKKEKWTNFSWLKGFWFFRNIVLPCKFRNCKARNSLIGQINP